MGQYKQTNKHTVDRKLGLERKYMLKNQNYSKADMVYTDKEITICKAFFVGVPQSTQR